MGSSASLPHRVNIIYAGRYALCKEGFRDGSLDLVHVEVLDRTHTTNKWLMHMDRNNFDAKGRPVLCIIRNDRHPQRSLRAGDPVTADSAQWVAAHHWLLEYEDDHRHEAPHRKVSASGAFRLCSLFDRRYLTVDETAGTLVMQNQPPDLFWEFCDASAVSRNSDDGTFCSASSFSAASSTSSLAVPPPSEKHWLGVFEGSFEEAVSAAPSRPIAGSQDPFASPETFFSQGEKLGEVELLQAPASLLEVCEALFGPLSDFRKRLAGVEQGELASFKPVCASKPWCVGTTAHYRIAVPVIGQRPFQEDTRLILCQSVGDGLKLVVQAASKLSLGLGMSFPTASLHIFTQAEVGQGAVCLAAWGLVPAGRHQQRALKGMRDKWDDYVHLARTVLAEI
eukprot:TRINITY_DN60858_c0_g1_i1.p1 TRINITY_DN60858_c0_g1~~TRINITY_DN60858_c0_g1_i1.p1  ORF type:complete len:395 (-),score=54.90 TRINITY_DN60858_c0_g1_i1:16-1200(-)